MNALLRLRRRAARGDRGAVAVEFALVAPLLFLMMFVLADFALAELSDTAGSNAAREGARVGILHYEGAHTSGANRDLITDAVESKLANNVKGTPTVTVRCLEQNGTARPGGGSCSTVSGNEVDIGEDLIEVSVTWTRKGGITGFIGSTTRSNKAVMRIVGSPPEGADPPDACEITAGSASPSAVTQSGGDLPAITFAVTVNDAALCGTPLLAFPAQSGYVGSQTMNTTGTANTYDFTMAAGQGSWTTGTKTVTASANGGAVTRAITFTVNDPAVCLITSATATPGAVNQSGGTLSSAVVFGVTVSDVTACGTPTLTFPAAADYPSPQTMGSAGGNSFTFTLPVGQGSWSSQTYTITANTTGDSEAISLIVSSAPTCSLGPLTPNPATLRIKKNTTDEIDGAVTFQVSKSAACGNNLTIRITPGPSGTGTGDLTIARAMTCQTSFCTYTVPDKAKGWNASPAQRTVTITDPGSGVTLTGTVNMLQLT